MSVCIVGAEGKMWKRRAKALRRVLAKLAIYRRSI
jgi:hypothetical protein